MSDLGKMLGMGTHWAVCAFETHFSHNFLSSRLHRAGKFSIMLEHNAINLDVFCRPLNINIFSGFYCKLRSTAPRECPVRYYCKEGSASPTRCPRGTTSEKGSVECVEVE
jgi:hypothetical protein